MPIGRTYITDASDEDLQELMLGFEDKQLAAMLTVQLT